MPADHPHHLRPLRRFLTLFYLAWAVRVFAIGSWLEPLAERSPTAYHLLAELLRFLLWTLPLGIYVFTVNRGIPPTQWLGLTGRPDRRWLAIVGAGMLIWLAAVLLVEDHAVRTPEIPWLLFGFKAFVVPFTEELFFRGLVLSELKQRFAFARANLIQAALFMAAHFAWIWYGGFDLTDLYNFAYVFVFGMLWGFVTHRTRSLWPAVLWHVANNLLSGWKI
jgi:membrane protease YdiL (CAAX protease family)